MKAATSSDWGTKPMPAMCATIALDRSFTADEMDLIRQGVVPEEMEDKWFVYWEDDTLFFHRSWTGICVYIVRFARECDTWRMVEAVVNRDPEQRREGRDEDDGQMISFLVDVLLLHRVGDLPGEGLSDARRSLKSWALVGRAMLGQHPGDESDCGYEVVEEGDE